MNFILFFDFKFYFLKNNISFNLFLDLHSEDVVHAYSPHIKEIEVDTELGLSKPFPFPTQHDFRVRRTGAQSLLVLPQRYFFSFFYIFHLFLLIHYPLSLISEY